MIDFISRIVSLDVLQSHRLMAVLLWKETEAVVLSQFATFQRLVKRKVCLSAVVCLHFNVDTGTCYVGIPREYPKNHIVIDIFMV